MTPQEQQQAATEFAAKWANRGNEKSETHNYWIGLLQEVLNVVNAHDVIEFEKPVQLTHTSFIDGYIPETKVLIEQKSLDIDLQKPALQSDGSMLTPYQQAKRYANEMPYDIRPRWIVVCNFAEIHIHDMNQPTAEPEVVLLKNLAKEYYRLQFLINQKNENIRREEEVSLKAGVLVGKLYDALYKEYINPDAESLRALNILCVRLVFCFYAEDAGLFETKTTFEDYIKSFSLTSLRDGMNKLFKALDTPIEKRDKYDTALQPFPYINGGLFAEEGIEIPNFTQAIVDVIVNHCAPFNWREISPTIFGAVFESTLNPETRRKGGMHYTSIANIHKVIDPLFMNDLEQEFAKICKTAAAKTKADKLLTFQHKIGNLKFLDPACGSGNFLTETYLSLRRLENKIITILNKGEKVLGFDEFICVNINQFYGIEINDFAVTVARTALWIAESQMIAETESILGRNIDFLPLKNHANIVEGNALRMDWRYLYLPEQETTIIAKQTNLFYENQWKKEAVAQEPVFHYDTINLYTDKVTIEPKPETPKPVQYDYIMGNPPFVGKKEQSKEQKNELLDLFDKSSKGVGNIDYVSGWYMKALYLIQNTKTKCAFVSTNSITQGEQVPILWKELRKLNINILFAYRTFRWYSESTLMAHVHCVIIGFSVDKTILHKKTIYYNEKNNIEATTINPYLVDAPIVLIENRTKSICDVPKIMYGSMPIDDGHLILEEEEVGALLKENPDNIKFVRKYAGGTELLHNIDRWCLWLKDLSPKELKSSAFIRKRIKDTELYRLSSSRPQTLKLAETPYLFGEIRQPDTDMLVIPKVSSENRKYIPISFVKSSTIISGSALIIPGASLFNFAILTSTVHNAWMRAVCGRLEMRYQYSGNVVYNNFPWCNPTTEQKIQIEKTSQSILDARALYPDSTLADMYDTTFMPPELRKAHQANDKAVMQAYGFDPNMSESEIVAELFKLYQKLTTN